MLTSFPHVPGADVATICAGAIWIDLMDASADEIGAVEQAIGRRIPTLAQLSEVEHSSRLAVEGDGLRLSLPIAHRPVGGAAIVHPVGFIVSPERLVTVRFAHLHSFDDVAAKLAARTGPLPAAPDVFVTLMEAMIDRMADVLEGIGGRLETISSSIFAGAAPQPSKPAQASRAMQDTLVAVGQSGGELAKIRDSLLGVARMVPFVLQTGRNLIPPALIPRVETLRQDVDSLQHYESHLAEKVQFLLDATLGFISIEQSNIVKVLTVISIVGIPPTLVAGIYGMNFKDIPELSWTYGYGYAWALMIASAILPLAWMKRRGWL